MKRIFKLVNYVALLLLTTIFLNSCYSVSENRIVKGKEIIPDSETTIDDYTIALSSESDNLIAFVVGKKIHKREILVNYLIDRSAKIKENPSCVEKWNILCIFPLFLEVPTLIWRTWNTEITVKEMETVPEKIQFISVDDLKINICGKNYTLSNGKSIIPSDSCKNNLNKPQLISLNGKTIETVSIDPDLASVYENIQLEKDVARREKELYSRSHYWLYCSDTGYSSVSPSVTREFLRKFKLVAFDESSKCEDSAWTKNQMASQMGIGCICKYMTIDKNQADKLNER